MAVLEQDPPLGAAARRRAERELERIAVLLAGAADPVALALLRGRGHDQFLGLRGIAIPGGDLGRRVAGRKAQLDRILARAAAVRGLDVEPGKLGARIKNLAVGADLGAQRVGNVELQIEARGIDADRPVLRFALGRCGCLRRRFLVLVRAHLHLAGGEQNERSEGKDASMKDHGLLLRRRCQPSPLRERNQSAPCRGASDV